MNPTPAGRCFGYAWLAFASALALHVTDEATHDFLSVYNPNAIAIRARFPFLPVPTFTFATWLALLVAAITLLFALSPLAFRGARWLRLAAVPVSVLFGIANASLHLLSSLYYQRLMPGVLSSPVLLLAAAFLLLAALKKAAIAAPTSVAQMS
jgi:hypothetical protein